MPYKALSEHVKALNRAHSRAEKLQEAVNEQKKPGQKRALRQLLKNLVLKEDGGLLLIITIISVQWRNYMRHNNSLLQLRSVFLLSSLINLQPEASHRPFSRLNCM
jgi:hypothetical protein